MDKAICEYIFCSRSIVHPSLPPLPDASRLVLSRSIERQLTLKRADRFDATIYRAFFLGLDGDKDTTVDFSCPCEFAFIAQRIGIPIYDEYWDYHVAVALKDLELSICTPSLYHLAHTIFFAANFHKLDLKHIRSDGLMPLLSTLLNFTSQYKNWDLMIELAICYVCCSREPRDWSFLSKLMIPMHPEGSILSDGTCLSADDYYDTFHASLVFVVLQTIIQRRNSATFS